MPIPSARKQNSKTATGVVRLVGSTTVKTDCDIKTSTGLVTSLNGDQADVVAFSPKPKKTSTGL